MTGTTGAPRWHRGRDAGGWARLSAMWSFLLACAAETQPNPPPAAPPAARPPDVLLVVLDTLRADATTLGGSSRPTTPNLARLAQAGVTWSDVTTAGTWTWPSHGTLFTGLGPWAHGADFAPPTEEGTMLPGTRFWVSQLDPKVRTLAEAFGAAGYDTRLAAANPWLGPTFGLARGFATTFGEPHDAPVVEQATAWMADAQKPLFLTINLITTHAPNAAHAVPWLPADPGNELRTRLAPFLLPEGSLFAIHGGPDFRQSPGFRYTRGELPLDAAALDLWRRVYDSEAWYVDQALGVVLNAWDQAGHGDGIVVVTSDHGEYLGEHGRFDHGRHVHTEVTAVPLVIRAPRKLPKGVVVDVPASNIGIFGMILDLAGLDRGDRPRLPGPKDRPTPILADARPDTSWIEAVGGEYSQGHRLYREGQSALVVDDDGRARLYDLTTDRAMQHDLASARPEEVTRLSTAAATAFPRCAPTGAVQGTSETTAALEALGYVAPSP